MEKRQTEISETPFPGNVPANVPGIQDELTDAQLLDRCSRPSFHHTYGLTKPEQRQGFIDDRKKLIEKLLPQPKETTTQLATAKWFDELLGRLEPFISSGDPAEKNPHLISLENTLAEITNVHLCHCAAEILAALEQINDPSDAFNDPAVFRSWLDQFFQTYLLSGGADELTQSDTRWNSIIEKLPIPPETPHSQRLLCDLDRAKTQIVRERVLGFLNHIHATFPDTSPNPTTDAAISPEAVPATPIDPAAAHAAVQTFVQRQLCKYQIYILLDEHLFDEAYEPCIALIKNLDAAGVSPVPTASSVSAEDSSEPWIA